MTCQRLNNESIYTIGDLLAYKKEIPGLNLKKIHDLAKRSLARDTRVSNHTWYNSVAHIARNGRSVRVILGDIVISKFSIGIIAKWHEGGSVAKTRVVSLMHIAAMHRAWLASDIVSDDSDDEDGENVPVSVQVPRLVDTLPKLLVAAKDITDKEMKTALSKCVREVNSLCSLLDF